MPEQQVNHLTVHALTLLLARSRYPQMWQDEDQLAVIWSSGDIPRGIRAASLPLPPTDKKAVSIRNNTYFQDARPEVAAAARDGGTGSGGTWLRFYGHERLQTRAPLRLSDRVVSAGAWLRLAPTLGRSGALLDTRGKPRGGFIFGLSTKIKPGTGGLTAEEGLST